VADLGHWPGMVAAPSSHPKQLSKKGLKFPQTAADTDNQVRQEAKSDYATEGDTATRRDHR
jgi:hypothetical protein